MRLCQTILISVVMLFNVSASILSETKIRSEIIDAVEFVAAKPLYQILLHQKPLMLTLKKMKSIEVLEGLDFLFTTSTTKVAIRKILSSGLKRKLLIYYLAKGCDRKYKYDEKRLAEFIKSMDLNSEIIEKHVKNKEWKEFITEVTNTV